MDGTVGCAAIDRHDDGPFRLDAMGYPLKSRPPGDSRRRWSGPNDCTRRAGCQVRSGSFGCPIHVGLAGAIDVCPSSFGPIHRDTASRPRSRELRGHTRSISGPRARNLATSWLDKPLSVMRVWNLATSANLQKLVTPNLVDSPVNTRRVDTSTALLLTAQTAGSGVVSPCFTDMPFAPRMARSMTRSESMSMAQWSTVPRVCWRTLPPSNSTVVEGDVARTAAAVRDGVITVSGWSSLMSSSASIC